MSLSKGYAGLLDGQSRYGHWRLLIGVLAGSAMVCAGGLWARAALHARTDALEAQIATAPDAAPRPQAASVERDFVADLDTNLPTRKFIDELQRACTAAGVAIGGVAVTENGATAEALGLQEWTVELRGGYAPTKQVLALVLGQFSAATVRSLRMRRDDGTGGIDTHVVFALRTAPTR